MSSTGGPFFRGNIFSRLSQILVSSSRIRTAKLHGKSSDVLAGNYTLKMCGKGRDKWLNFVNALLCGVELTVALESVAYNQDSYYPARGFDLHDRHDEGSVS